MKIAKKFVAFLVAFILVIGLVPCTIPQAEAETIKLGYIFETGVRIRKDASTSSEILDQVSNWNVTVLGSKNDTQGTKNPATGKAYIWYKVTYNASSGTVTGYVREDLITVTEHTTDATFEETLKAFPESYRAALIELHAKYPNWKFVADKVNTTFAQAVAAQDKEYTKLVETKYNSWRSMRNKCYNWTTGKFITTDGGRYGASTEVIAYYMDPRNFLNANDIYVFMQQSYDSTTQTLEGVQKILDGTFLEGKVTDKNDRFYGKPYAGVIRYAGSQSGVNAYVLASTIIQEHGTKGTTLSKGYDFEYTDGKTKKIYNFFNFGASGTTSAQIIKNGAKYAYDEGWFTPTEAIAGASGKGYIFETDVIIRKDATTESDKIDKVSELTVTVSGSKTDVNNAKNSKTGKVYTWYKVSYTSGSKTITGYVREDLIKFVEGGAVKYGKNYIAVGQNTYYYKNYNVLNPNKLWHQYAQNVADSLSSSRRLKNTYSQLYDLSLTFRIPVYDSMPKTVSKLPAKSEKYNNYYFDNIKADGLSPAFNRYTYKYSLSVNGDTSIYCELPEGATFKGKSNYELKKGENTVTLTVCSQTGYTRDYTITVTAAKAATLSIQRPGGTLVKEDDGKWYYYVDGKRVNATTLVKYSGKWFYVKDGVWTKDTTLVKYSGKWFYIENGKWNSEAETLVKYNGVWFYIKDGKWDKTAETLVKYSNKWFYVKGGKWVKDTLIFTFKEKDFYIKSGIAQLDYSGKATVNGVTYKISKGKVVK